MTDPSTIRCLALATTSSTLGVRHWFSPEYSVDLVARLQTQSDFSICTHSSPSEVLSADCYSHHSKWSCAWLLQEFSLLVALCRLVHKSSTSLQQTQVLSAVWHLRLLHQPWEWGIGSCPSTPLIWLLVNQLSPTFPSALTQAQVKFYLPTATVAIPSEVGHGFFKSFPCYLPCSILFWSHPHHYDGPKRYPLFGTCDYFIDLGSEALVLARVLHWFGC